MEGDDVNGDVVGCELGDTLVGSSVGVFDGA